MPELPDVQVFREYIDATSLHGVVDDVHVDEGPELDRISARSLAATLRGRSLESTTRHGKHLFVELSGTPENWLRLHFGMTGSLQAWSGEDPAESEHVRLRLDLADGRHLAYRCPRRLGELGVVESPEKLIQARALGPDPLEKGENGVDREAFGGLLEGRRGRIKTTLMNQKVLAGLGNVYTDEILFQTEVSPESKVPELDEDVVSRVHRAMLRIVRKAIDVRADPRRMPRRWLISRREAGRSCPRCGGTIQKIEVGGRPTYVCDTHQQALGPARFTMS